MHDWNPTDKCVKIENVLFAKDRGTVYFVELKPTPGHRVPSVQLQPIATSGDTASPAGATQPG